MLDPFYELIAKFFESRIVRLASCADQKIHRDPHLLQPRQQFTSRDLPQTPLQTIAVDDSMAMLRHHHAEPRIQKGGSGEDDVQMTRLRAFPPREQPPDVGTRSDPDGPGKSRDRTDRTRLGSRGAPAVHPSYLEPIFTVSLARPFLRRALSTARPLRVFIRARKPCLLTRLRLRGRYVGFMAC